MGDKILVRRRNGFRLLLGLARCPKAVMFLLRYTLQKNSREQAYSDGVFCVFLFVPNIIEIVIGGFLKKTPAGQSVVTTTEFTLVRA